MSFFYKTSKLARLVSQPKKIFCSAKHLFILSHMRSRSSVFSHILGSNAQIEGYRELHQGYQSYYSLLQMRFKLYKDNESALTNKYLLDKILHNKYEISDRMINKMNPKFIFLLREPVSTINSIIRLGKLTNNHSLQQNSTAIDYYCIRLSALEKISDRIPTKFLVIDSDSITNKTDSTLSQLSYWLELDVNLSSEYDIFKKTGVVGAGDPSTNIQQGKLVRGKNNHDQIDIDSTDLVRIKSAYDRTMNKLSQLGTLLL